MNGSNQRAQNDTASTAVPAAPKQGGHEGVQPAGLEQAEGGQSSLQRAMSQLTAADSMLLSANLLNSSSSQEAEPAAEQAEGQQDSRHEPPAHCPQIAVNIQLPSEVIVEENRKWQGR